MIHCRTCDPTGNLPNGPEAPRRMIDHSPDTRLRMLQPFFPPSWQSVFTDDS